jgi:hypothetical protein
MLIVPVDELDAPAAVTFDDDPVDIPMIVIVPPALFLTPCAALFDPPWQFPVMFIVPVEEFATPGL